MYPRLPKYDFFISSIIILSPNIISKHILEGVMMLCLGVSQHVCLSACLPLTPQFTPQALFHAFVSRPDFLRYRSSSKLDS